MNSLEILCANLRNLRLSRGLTQEVLAEKAGVTCRHYQDIEAGRRPGLQVATVDRLAAALGETASHLLEAGRYAEPEAKRGRNPHRIVR
ncbi:putative transcriptional regulator [Opitutaceae bacterium TAV1]|nr:DNA-binding protein [Opitutaceae bacterium TAV5]EIQ01415.1 putative transcriptional regulator [Opitutaceae bacterium TAV1]